MEDLLQYESPPSSPKSKQSLNEPEKTSKSVAICQVCGVKEAKYRCPACDCRSCCLECSKQHKEDSDCDGKRKITHFIGIDQFTDSNLQDDFNFLENVTRSIDNAKRRKVALSGDRAKLSYTLKRLAHQAHKRNITLSVLPTGMSKRNSNTTYFDHSKRTIFWKTEWVFVKEGFKLTDNKVDETVPLIDVLNAHFDNVSVRHKLLQYTKIKDQLSFLLKVEHTPVNQPQYYTLNSSHCLKEALQFKEIIEFPSIVVVLPEELSSFVIIPSPTEVKKKDQTKSEVSSEATPTEDTHQEQKDTAINDDDDLNDQ